MGKDRFSNDGTTPICRCRVMYLGSSVPHATKDGLQGIQEPLRDLYPESGLVDYGSAGIDSWISVWSNGILVENVDDSGREMKRFFPIESLHYCAAVRYVVIPSLSGHNARDNSNTNTTTPNNGVTLSVTSPNSPSSQQQQHQSSSSSMLNPTSSSSPGQNNGTNGANHINSSPTTLTNGDNGDKSYDKVAKFLPLDSPFLRGAENGHPPLFACILRRTTGIKVLECHAFICKREPAANALVRCCFHAYADSMYAKQIEENPYSHIGSGPSNGSHITTKRSRSISALDTVDKADGNWNDSSPNSRDLLDELPPPPPPPHNHHHHSTNGQYNHHHQQAPSEIGAGSTVSQSPDEDNYKVTWPPGGPPPPLSSGHYIREAPISTMRPGMIGKPRPMIIHMGPPPPHGGSGPRFHPAMMPGPPPFGMPIALSDHPHADKILKHSLKKKKKKSKSKMLLNGSSLLIGPGPGPFPVPVNFVQVPQLSPQGSDPHHHHLIHHQQQQQHPHNTIYGPLPIPPPPSGALPPPPPGSTAYSVRTRLRRGHSSGGGGLPPPQPPPPGEYPIMFTGPGDEPIYIPPMRPLTPLSNYHVGGHHHHSVNPQHHHPHHLHHHQQQQQPTESHYVSYPVTYGTTPRRDKYRSKDRINGVSRSVLGGISSVEGEHHHHHNGNHGGNGGGGGGGGTTGEDETERDSSPSAVGLYKRKGHLNERAFSYSIRQEHRSRSNSLANLAIDDGIPVGRPINGSGSGGGGSGSSGGERGDEDHLHDNHHSHHQHHPNHHHNHNHHHHHHQQQQQQHVNHHNHHPPYSSSARHHHDSRRGSSSAFGDRERERSSIHSSGHFHHHHGSTNGGGGGNYGGSRDSFIDYRDTIGHREMSLSTSMANLNLNGHSSLESKNVPKTASIKRSSKQRNSLGSKGMPIAPPLPPPTLTNGNSKSESKSMRKL